MRHLRETQQIERAQRQGMSIQYILTSKPWRQFAYAIFSITMQKIGKEPEGIVMNMSRPTTEKNAFFY